MPDNFVGLGASPDGRTEVWHLDGVSWFAAPVPRRLHRCWAQTKGYVNHFEFFERCACGAVRRDGGRWMLRNEAWKRGPRRRWKHRQPMTTK